MQLFMVISRALGYDAAMSKKELINAAANTDIKNKINQFFFSYPESTRSAYISDLKTFHSLINVSLPEIQESDIITYVNKLEGLGLKNATFNRKLYSLSKILDVYKAYGLIETNPIKDIKVLRKLDKPVTRNIDVNLTLDQVKHVIDISPIKPALLIQFLTTSGIRISELLDIKKTYIKPYNDEVVKIDIVGKGHKERHIFIKHELLNQVLRIHTADSEYLFHDKLGRRLSRQNVSNMIQRCFKKIGKNITPHVLRHVYANHQINTS